MLVRPFVSLLLFAVASTALVACTGTEEDGTPEPIVPTATLALTASPGADESPEPTETSPTSEDEARRTGDPDLDAIVEAVEERDMAAIASLVQYQTLPCTTEQGIGGPPKCEEGQTDGDEATVFPVAVCEGEWRARAVFTLSELVLGARGFHAAVEPTDGATLGGEWPESDTLLVFHQELGDEFTGSRLHIADGRIIGMMRNCDIGLGPAALMGPGGADAEPYPTIAGPWDEPVEGESIEAPSTGVDAVDGILALVANYDAAGLAESARRAMEDLPPQHCEVEPMGPGVLACGEKDSPDDPISVFPLAFCEGVLERDPMRAVQVVLDGAPDLHAVVEAPDEESPSDLDPHGAYWIVYGLTTSDTAIESAARLHVTAEGDLTSISFGCGESLDQLLQFEGEPLPEVEVREE